MSYDYGESWIQAISEIYKDFLWISFMGRNSSGVLFKTYYNVRNSFYSSKAHSVQILFSSDNGQTWETYVEIAEPEGFKSGVILNDTICLIGKNSGKIYRIDVSNIFPTSSGNTYINEISVYPNPTTNIVNIDGLNNNFTMTLFLYNSQGILVKRVEIDESKIQLSLQDLPLGSYIIRIKEGLYFHNFKVVKI